MGQIKAVGETFYGLDVDIEFVKEEFVGNMVHVTMQLRFDNSAFLTEGTSAQDILDEMRIESDLFFEAFPFHIVFTEDLIVKSAGLGLANVMPNIEGECQRVGPSTNCLSVYQVRTIFRHNRWSGAVSHV